MFIKITNGELKLNTDLLYQLDGGEGLGQGQLIEKMVPKKKSVMEFKACVSSTVIPISMNCTVRISM